MSTKHCYEVVWRRRIIASSHEEAASMARETMIDPGETEATFEVTATGITSRSTKIVVAQDPDRSDD